MAKQSSLRLLWVGIGLLILYAFFARVFYNISLVHPLQVSTSGMEEESLFVFWKSFQGLKVYGDPYQIPYSASYFNWLYYALYLPVVKFANQGANIPNVARLFTLFFSLILSFITFRFSKLLQLSKAAQLIAPLVPLSPLFGFWVITARPDILATLLEVLALIFCVKYVRLRQLSSLVWIVLFCYLSWSAKQSYVNVISGFCIWLILSKQIKPLLFCVVSMFALFTLSFTLGDELYRFSILKSQMNMSLNFHLGVTNWILFLSKTLPIMLPLAFCALKKEFYVIIKTSAELQLLACIFIVTTTFNGALVFKLGAGDNYFFMSTLLGFFMLGSVYNRITLKWAHWGAGLAYLGILLMLVTEVRGKLNLQGQNQLNQKVTDCVNSLPNSSTALVNDLYAQLPWVNTRSTGVYTNTLQMYFENGNFSKYEAGGIKGLIGAKKFDYLVNLQTTAPIFNPEWMERNYQLSSAQEILKSCASFQVYQKVE
jgi:hypothetical protein